MSPLLRKAGSGTFFLISQLSEVILFGFIYWALEAYEPGVNYEGIKCDSDDTWCSTAVKFFYYSLCIQSTIGYGDITPKSEKARILNIIQILLVYGGLAVTSLPSLI